MPSRKPPQLVLQAYPAAVRDWIVRRGGLSSRLLLLRGRELSCDLSELPIAPATLGRREHHCLHAGN